MKKKILTPIIAILCVFVFCSCASTNYISVSANWYKDTTLTTTLSNTYEKLEYAITYDDSKKTNKNTTVVYNDGASCVTELSEAVYTYSDSSTERCYKLTNTISISGTYTVGDKTKPFEDSVESYCYFKTADKLLQPIESFKTVKSTSVIKASGSLDEVIKEYNYSYKIVYDKNCKNATLTYKDLTATNPEEKVTEKKNIGGSNSIIDNEQIYFVIRGFDLSSSFGQAVSVLNASANKMQNLSITCYEELKDYSAFNTTISCMKVNIRLNETLSGATQTAYYAKKVDNNNNTYRNAMVKLETPISYNMGTLVYTLGNYTFTTN